MYFLFLENNKDFKDEFAENVTKTGSMDESLITTERKGESKEGKLKLHVLLITKWLKISLCEILTDGDLYVEYIKSKSKSK